MWTYVTDVTGEKYVSIQETHSTLHSVHIPIKIWSQIAINPMTTLTQGTYVHKYVIAVIDCFNKYPELIQLKDKSAKEVAYHLYKLFPATDLQTS